MIKAWSVGCDDKIKFYMQHIAYIGFQSIILNELKFYQPMQRRLALLI